MIAPGDLVSFYQEGWKTGTLLETNGFTSTIQPIGPKGKKMRKVTLSADDVKEIEK